MTTASSKNVGHDLLSRGRFSGSGMRRVKFSLAQFKGDIALTATAIVLIVALLVLNTASTYFTHVGTSETNWIAIAYNYSYPGRTGFALTAVIGAQIATRSLTRGSLSRLYIDSFSRIKVFASFVGASSIYILAISLIFSLFHWCAVTGVLNVVGAFDGLPDLILTYAAIRAILVLFLWGLIGFSLGLIIRSPFITVSVVLGIVLIIEPTLTAVANEIGDQVSFLTYLPGSLNWALTWPQNDPYVSRVNAESIAYGLAGFLLFVYTGILLLIGWWRTPVSAFCRRS